MPHSTSPSSAFRSRAFPLRECRQAAAAKYGLPKFDECAPAAPATAVAAAPRVSSTSTQLSNMAVVENSFTDVTVTAAVESFSIDAWANPVQADATSPYASAAVPAISLTNYASRLSRALLQRDQTVALGLVLALRHREMTGHKATRLTAHRLLLVATHIAQKTHYDQCACNSYVAEAGGINRVELAELEWQFLADLDYKVLVTGEDWLHALKSLGVDAVSNASISDDDFAAGFSCDSDL